MPTQLSISNLQSTVLTSIAAASPNPSISTIEITDSSWTILDDTAVDTNGGYLIVNGSSFVSGCSVLIDNTLATKVSFINSTKLQVTVPGLVAKTYHLYVCNPDGSTGIKVNGVTYSSLPIWVTGSSLSSVASGSSFSVQLTATDAVSYSLQTGSLLPYGITLSSGGLLSGSIRTTNPTTFNFTVVATDAQLQDSPRTFSLVTTIALPGVPIIGTATLAINPTISFIGSTSDGGSTITSYTVVSVPAGGKGTIYQSGSGTITVTGLTPNTAYTFRVYATNAAGNSATSDQSNQISTYPAAASADFTANGSITTPNSALFALPSSSTIEFFLRIASASHGSIYSLFSCGNANNQFQFISVLTNNAIGVGSAHTPVGSGSTGQTTSTLNANTWYHIACVINSGTLSIYFNGVSQPLTGTTTGYNTSSVTVFHVIGNYAGGGSYYLNGYMSQVRILSTALYTGTFSPPTNTLTNTSAGSTGTGVTGTVTTSNTILLAFTTSTVTTDSSTNNFALTVGGSVTSSTTVAPF